MHQIGVRDRLPADQPQTEQGQAQAADAADQADQPRLHQALREHRAAAGAERAAHADLAAAAQELRQQQADHVEQADGEKGECQPGLQPHVAGHHAVVVQPLHQTAQARVLRPHDASQRSLLRGVAIQELPVCGDLAGIAELHPQAHPCARRVLQMARPFGHVPAGELLEIAVVEFEAGEERREHILRLAVELRGVAIGEAPAGHGVEHRRRTPRLQHADDAHVRVAQAQHLADTVAAAEQLAVEIVGDHRHPRMPRIVVRAPAAAVAERHVEHGEEIAGGGKHARHQGRQIDPGRAQSHRAVHHQRLAVGAPRAPQVHCRLVIHHVQRLLEIARRRIAVHLRIEQRAAAGGHRIAGEQMHHGQRGHAGADAHRDGNDHQRGEHLVALEAAQGQIQVIAEHSISPWSNSPPPPGEGLGERVRPARDAALRPVPSSALRAPSPKGRRENHTDLVATTGGTAAARNAGPSTASWPISHSAMAPVGK